MRRQITLEIEHGEKTCYTDDGVRGVACVFLGKKVSGWYCRRFRTFLKGTGLNNALRCDECLREENE